MTSNERIPATDDATGPAMPTTATEESRTGKRRRRRGGKGRRQQPQQSAAPQPNTAPRAPREKATIAGRLALAREQGDTQAIENLERFAAWRDTLEVIVTSEIGKAIAEARWDLREYFAEALTAKRAYHDADTALRGVEVKRERELKEVLAGDPAVAKEKAAALAQGVRDARTRRADALRCLKEHSVELDLYFELLSVLPPPPRHGDRAQRGPRAQQESRSERRDDRPRENGSRRGRRDARRPDAGGRGATQRVPSAPAASTHARVSANQQHALRVSIGDRLAAEGLGRFTSSGTFVMSDDETPSAPASTTELD